MKFNLSILVLTFIMAPGFAKADGWIHPDIVGGMEAAIGEIPFIVSLQESDNSHFCGGSLIKKNWVLTAAHCVQQGVDHLVIGLHDRTDTRNTEVFKVKKIVAHPKYDADRTDFDYALIELDKDSSFRPIDLNSKEIRIPELSQKPILATTAGWGTLSEGASSLPTKLQKVEIPLVAKKICDDAYPGQITDQMICAGLEEGGKDSCQGDSGGPLYVASANHNYLLIGTVSWGNGCAQKKQYGVYGKVSAAYDWIQQTIN